MLLKIKIGVSKKLKGIRAIIADQFISKGEIIEKCPVVLIPIHEIDMISNTTMTKYEFYWNDSFEAVVLGYGSLLNHAEDANVEFEPDYENNFMVFSAKKDILEGEELFIHYMQGAEHEGIPSEYLDYKH